MSHHVSSCLIMSHHVPLCFIIYILNVSHHILCGLVLSHPLNHIPSHRFISYFLPSCHLPSFFTVIPLLQPSEKPLPHCIACIRPSWALKSCHQITSDRSFPGTERSNLCFCSTLSGGLEPNIRFEQSLWEFVDWSRVELVNCYSTITNTSWWCFWIVTINFYIVWNSDCNHEKKISHRRSESSVVTMSEVCCVVIFLSLRFQPWKSNNHAHPCTSFGLTFTVNLQVLA